MNWELILSNIVNVCVDIAWKLIASAIVFFLGRYLIKLLLKFFPNGKKFSMDETVRVFTHRFISIALHCVLAISIVAIMGVPMASVITVFATAGAAIALAVQGSLSNFMGGIMLLIFKPIKIGEVVDVSGQCGVVSEVGFFYTELKTFDNLHVSIPNATMTSSVIINYSREDIRRADVVINVSRTADIGKVKEIVTAVIKANDQILDKPEPFVAVTNINDYSAEITIRGWCEQANVFPVKFYLLEECKKEFEEAGIDMPTQQFASKK